MIRAALLASGDGVHGDVLLAQVEIDKESRRWYHPSHETLATWV
jgi:hypothetical protein